MASPKNDEVIQCEYVYDQNKDDGSGEINYEEFLKSFAYFPVTK